MSFCFDTFEAGAGIYPEPPYTPEPEVKECEECGETRWLTETDGRVLCTHCRAEILFDESTHEDRMAFINDGDQDELKDFYITFYFYELGTRDKIRIVQKYFEENVSDDDKDFFSKVYVKEIKDSFAEYMERRAKK